MTDGGYEKKFPDEVRAELGGLNIAAGQMGGRGFAIVVDAGALVTNAPGRNFRPSEAQEFARSYLRAMERLLRQKLPEGVDISSAWAEKIGSPRAQKPLTIGLEINNTNGKGLTPEQCAQLAAALTQAQGEIEQAQQTPRDERTTEQIALVIEPPNHNRDGTCVTTAASQRGW